MKKLLSIFLALAMAVSSLAVSSVAFAKQGGGVTVEFSVFDEGVYTMLPEKINVTADLSDKYAEQIGYNDTIEEPSILDAMIEASIVTFGEEDFMEYAPIRITEEKGYPMFISIFGEQTNALAYRVNGESAMGPNEAVKESDYVELMFYQDRSFYGDKYTFFDKRSIDAHIGEEITLNLSVEDYDENWNPAILPAADVMVTVDFEDYASTDVDGKITLSFDEIGTYYISASGYYENDYDEYEIFAPWCEINVTNQLYDDVQEKILAAAEYLVPSADSFTTDNAADFLIYLKSGYDMSEYEDEFIQSVKDNLDKNSGKLLATDYSGNSYEDIGLYGAVIQSVWILGYVPVDFYGYDLISAFEEMDVDSGSYNPYYYRIAIEVASDELSKKLCDQLIKQYRKGGGLNYYGYATDNTATFLAAIAPYADDYDEYVKDAKAVIQKCTVKDGAYYNSTYKNVNADSTAISLMAYSNIGEIAPALKYYKNLVDGFASSTGAFQYNGEDNAYATKDALMALEYFRDAVELFNIDYLKGWQRNGSDWYLFSNNSFSLTGWQKVKGKWYYMADNGVMQTGWQKVNGKWYFLNSNGDMKTGWLKDKGKWYYLNNSGAMQTGWKYINGKWYYFYSGGSMKTGWLKENGKWYYLDSNGAMVTGKKTINGKAYTFNKSGVMQ